MSKNDENQPSKKEMEELLRHGAYDILRDEGGDAVADETIEQILERRAERISVGDGEEQKGSKFSKAKFSSGGAGSSVDLDDPDFW